MGTIVRTLGAIVTYACVATIISQAIGISYLVFARGLSRDRVQQIVAIVRGQEMVPADSITDNNDDKESRRVSFDEINASRVRRSLDLTLREQALAKGLGDLRRLQTKLEWQTKVFDTRKEEFKHELARLEAKAQNDAIANVRQTLEAMDPRFAKEQLVQMMTDGDEDAVVSMIKSMQIDRKNEILAEFNNPQDKVHLKTILDRILRGEPQTSVIEDTRKQMELAQPVPQQ